MRIRLQAAATTDAADLASLQLSTDEHLISVYARRPRSGGLTEKGVLFTCGASPSTSPGIAVAPSLPLTLIDTKDFSASRRPLYLTSMAADPGQQRKGVGRLCIEEARQTMAE